MTASAAAKAGRGADPWQSLDQLVARQASASWVVDVRRESLMTSDTLASIVGTLRRLQLAGGRMAFIHVQPGVANILRSMRLTRLVPIYEDLASAITALAAPTAATR